MIKAKIVNFAQTWAAKSQSADLRFSTRLLTWWNYLMKVLTMKQNQDFPVFLTYLFSKWHNEKKFKYCFQFRKNENKKDKRKLDDKHLLGKMKNREKRLFSLISASSNEFCKTHFNNRSKLNHMRVRNIDIFISLKYHIFRHNIRCWWQ